MKKRKTFRSIQAVPTEGSEDRDRNKKGLSLIIPVYNASATIGATLLSAILFKPKNSEILVYIDGGSTQSRFMEYADSKSWIKIYRSSETRGLSYGLNFLISKSTKDVIARLDHDDIALPFQLDRSLRLITRNKVDIAFSNAILFGRGLRYLPFLPQTPYAISVNDSSTFLAIENPFNHPTMVGRKSSILGLGGYRNTIAEDYELWLRASLAGLRIARLRGYGVLYRLHAGQMTSQSSFKDNVSTDPEIRNHRKAIISRLGYTVTDSSLDKVAQMIRSDLEKNKLGFRVDSWMRRTLSLFASSKSLTKK